MTLSCKSDFVSRVMTLKSGFRGEERLFYLHGIFYVSVMVHVDQTFFYFSFCGYFFEAVGSGELKFENIST